MNRLLLIALPTLLAACTKPGGEPPATPPAAAVPAATAAATAASPPAAPAAANAVTEQQPAFENVPVIRAASSLPRQQWRLSTATDATGQPINALLVRTDKPLQLQFER